MRRVMGAVGTVILEILKWILRIILGALKSVLGLARIILLLFAMVARVFLSFVRMGTFLEVVSIYAGKGFILEL